MDDAFDVDNFSLDDLVEQNNFDGCFNLFEEQSLDDLE
jgi:hypothetical protein